MIELQNNKQPRNSFERIELMKLTHDALSLRNIAAMVVPSASSKIGFP